MSLKSLPSPSVSIRLRHYSAGLLLATCSLLAFSAARAETQATPLKPLPPIAQAVQAPVLRLPPSMQQQDPASAAQVAQAQTQDPVAATERSRSRVEAVAESTTAKPEAVKPAEASQKTATVPHLVAPASAKKTADETQPANSAAKAPASTESVNAGTPSVPAAPVSDEEFRRALLSTYENNPQIKAEREALAQLDEQLSQAVAGFFPTITGNYQRGRQRNDFGGVGWNYENQTAKTLVIDQPIFQGGETLSRILSAKNTIMAGRSRLLAVEQDRLGAAVQAYMDVYQGKAVMELSRNNVNVLKQQLQATQDRFSVGEVTRTDVAQSEARLSRAQSELEQAEGDLATARATFKRVVGYDAPDSLPLPPTAQGLPASLDEAAKLALGNNPNLSASKFSEQAAEKDVYTRVAALLPSVSVQGRLNREDGAGVRGDEQFDTDSLLLNVRVPLYQSGAEYGRIREAKNISQRRKFETLDTTDEVREQATRAWERYQSSRASIVSTQDSIKAAEVALDGVRQEQQYGARTTLDVLDAEQELFLARVNLVRAQRNEVVSMYNLVTAMGRLTAKDLALGAKLYDPEVHYDSAKFKLIGF